MCRWGCQTTDTTYMCKWCGTRFCKECLRGEFGTGIMRDSSWCFQCNQKKCHILCKNLGRLVYDSILC
ncbi:hypothetical protein EB796_016474 [Bugula neritina]|uniref:Uncharacterized protein n=1 Tax=Bugula neritina TaxID=10212 RepID=A0A7J7JIL7_BUGNE|nr:hypothetical protein EB796_016474 [Bugula neritina]